MVIPFPLYTALLDPVSCQRRPAKGHSSPQPQADTVLELHIERNGMENEDVVEQRQRIERLKGIHDPFLVQCEQRKNDNTGHGRYVIKAGFMYAKEKEFQQHKSSAEIFIKNARANLRNVQKPHTEAAGRHQRNHPKFPGHSHSDQTQHPTEHCGDNCQQQMPARLLPCPHLFSNSWATRFKSSFGG